MSTYPYRSFTSGVPIVYIKSDVNKIFYNLMPLEKAENHLDSIGALTLDKIFTVIEKRNEAQKILKPSQRYNAEQIRAYFQYKFSYDGKSFIIELSANLLSAKTTPHINVKLNILNTAQRDYETQNKKQLILLMIQKANSETIEKMYEALKEIN